MVKRGPSEERGNVNMHQKAWKTLTPTEAKVVWTCPR